MRRRERAFFLLLGTVSTFGLLAGAWPLPLIAFAVLELSFTSVEQVAARREKLARRARLLVRRYRRLTPRGILRSTS
jgi:hypothetical protein